MNCSICCGGHIGHLRTSLAASPEPVLQQLHGNTVCVHTRAISTAAMLVHIKVCILL